MKKSILCLIITAALISVSCEDTLSPKAEFKEEYTMYGILKVDTTFQTVYLSRSYQVDGFNGLENRTDPAIEGADVKMNVVRGRDTLKYTLQPASAPRNDVSRYNTPVKYYAINNYKPSDGDKVLITARLAGGKVLNSSTLVPPMSYLYYETSTANYDPLGEEGGGFTGIKFTWKFLSHQYNTTANYFAPRFELVYHKADNPSNKIRVKVPLYFVPNDGIELPLYPNVSTATTVQFYGDSIEKVLRTISAGDNNKANYVIDIAEFTLLLMDKNLASFLAAENTFADEFSTRIDAADFTNIDGGLGLFGSVATKKTKVKIAKTYIDTFGYKVSY